VAEAIELVHAERGRAVDNLFDAASSASGAKHAQDQIDQLVGAIANQDSSGIEAQIVADSLAQAAADGIGIAVIGAESAERIQSVSRGTVGVLVGIELDQLAHWHAQAHSHLFHRLGCVFL